jgi:integrase
MKFTLSIDKNAYRVSFVLEGKRKVMYLGTSDEEVARQIQSRMTNDWERGEFDISLASYKVGFKLLDKAIQYQEIRKISLLEKLTDIKLLYVWDKWVEELDLPDATRNNHYHCIRQMIKKVNPIWNEVDWYKESTLSASTWNIRRRAINSCIKWGLEEDLIKGKNPWSKLRARKTDRANVNPLNREEIKLVITAFSENTYCSEFSPVKHSYYAPFLKFLFLTAVRPGEATALQWKHIDFQNNVIEISQASSRNLAKSPTTTKRIIKDTKTGDIRYLPMNKTLRGVLEAHRPLNYSKDDLVFKGARGGSVLDYRAFREVWEKVLAGLGLEYRNPYQTRHSALSQIAMEHGLIAASKIAGHKSTEMVSRHYVKFVGELGQVMPDF